MKGESFYEIVTAAIDDFLTHGFDSSARLEEWLRKIEVAAVRSLVPIEVLQRTLHDMLMRVFQRTTRTETMLRRHKGIGRYTLERIKPKLHAELDRRILASADLIRLNRDEMIAQTLRRFAGWASSIPIGGIETTERVSVRKRVRSGIAGLPFEERRVIIDQGHKLSASVNEIVAVDGGAIAAIFHSHWREINYDFRPDHKDRDEKIYVLRGNWALKDGLMKLSGRQYTDEITRPAEEPFCRCLDGSTRIPFANIERIYRRRYAGQVLRLELASGKSLRLTPNHPVLTDHGWIPAQLLNVGDDVIETIDKIVEPVGESYKDESVPTISQIFDFALPAGFHKIVCGSREQFHRDGLADGDVDVVTPLRTLRIDRNSDIAKCGDELVLSNSDAYASGRGASCEHDIGFGLSGLQTTHHIATALFCLLAFVREAHALGFGRCAQSHSRLYESRAYWHIADTILHSDRSRRVAIEIGTDDFLRRKIKVLPAIESGRSFIANNDSDFFQSSADSGIGNFVSLCKLNGINPGSVRFGKVVDIERSSWAGHVYNLQTANGWYVANGILSHNCYYTYIYSLRDLPSDMLTEKGESELARVRQQLAGWPRVEGMAS